MLRVRLEDTVEKDNHTYTNRKNIEQLGEEYLIIVWGDTTTDKSPAIYITAKDEYNDHTYTTQSILNYIKDKQIW